MDFIGQTALITGGSRGIGRAIALELADAGADVAINYWRNERAALETCAMVRARGRQAEAFAADVGDPDQVAQLFERFAAHWPRLDMLVHNAAIGRFKPLLRIRPAQWEMTLRTNAQALLLLVRAGLPLLPRPGARVVAMSSLGSQRCMPHYGAVGVSKAALETVVRYLAVELAPQGVRVNAVSGGLIDNETLRAFPEFERLRATVIERTPGKRLGTPQDLAGVVRFLCAEESRWICGQTLVVDGGLSLQ